MHRTSGRTQKLALLDPRHPPSVSDRLPAHPVRLEIVWPFGRRAWRMWRRPAAFKHHMLADGIPVEKT